MLLVKHVGSKPIQTAIQKDLNHILKNI